MAHCYKALMQLPTAHTLGKGVCAPTVLALGLSTEMSTIGKQMVTPRLGEH